MKNPPKTTTLPPLPDRARDLSEEIAAEEEEDELEVLDKDNSNAAENLTAWDEPPGESGVRVSPTGFEDEAEFARQLAESGVDLADNEQREIRERDEMVEEAEELAAESGKTR